MLKQSVLVKIFSALEKSPFTVADFLVQPGQAKDDPILTVTFRHDTRFYFTVTESRGEYWLEVSPGEYKAQEFRQIESMQRLPDRLLEWARNVRDELRAYVPVYAELEELRETIDKHIAEHVEAPDEPFTSEQADELRAKLDILAQKFADLAEHNEITKQELNRLDQELTALKGNLSTFPRGTWYKTAGAKLWSVTSKIVGSKESREVLAQATRKAIGLD